MAKNNNKENPSDIAENKTLSQLNYQERAGLISLGLKKPSVQPFHEKDVENLMKDLPNNFIDYKFSSDPNYIGKATSSPKEDETDKDSFDTEDLNLEDSSFQDDESAKDTINSTEEESENVTQDIESDSNTPFPEKLSDSEGIFSNIDEKLNIKDDLKFDTDDTDTTGEPNDDTDEHEDSLNIANIDKLLEKDSEFLSNPLPESLTPIGETPIGETPIGETPIEETPIEETPIGETPIEETPIEETPIEETPIGETPIEETPIEETPIEETPIEETPIEETPIEETEASDKEASDKKITSNEDLPEYDDLPLDTSLSSTETNDSDDELSLTDIDDFDDDNPPPDEPQEIMDEEDNLYYDYKKSFEDSADYKFKEKKLKTILALYHPENKKFIHSLLDEKKLSNEEKESLINDIISEKNESMIIESLNQKLFNKTGYEIIERRQKKKLFEEKAFEKNYTSYRKKRGFLILIALTTFFLILTFSIYFGYKAILPYRLYQKAITAIKNDQHQESETFFLEAYRLHPKISYTEEIGNAYLKKKMIVQAEEKFNLLLNDFSSDLEVLIANARFYRQVKNYDKAHKILNQAKHLFPQNIVTMNEEVELLISEGKSLKDFKFAQTFWTRAGKITSDLIAQDSDKKDQYIQKKIEIAALNKEYVKAKNYFIVFNSLKATYELKPMITYLDFLIETQENYRNEVYLNPEKIGTGKESIFVISAVDKIFKQLEKENSEHYLLEMHKARWKSLNDELLSAQKHLEKSIEMILQEKNYLLNDDLVNAFNLLGILQLKKKEIIPAVESFQRSLGLNPKDYLANYYIGKINLLKLNQIQSAYDHFTASYEEWYDNDSQLYADLLYTLGYINFFTAKNNSSIKNKDNYFKQSIFFWSELSKKNLEKKNYLVDFNIATGYLYLKEYELAEIFYESNLEQLQNILRFYDQKSRLFVKNTTQNRKELQILSDVYNNLAVAQINKNKKKSSSPIDIPEKSIEYFINSITLKDKIGDLKGVPYANFNTLNDYPKHSLAFLNNRPLKIADTSIPRSLFPETF